MTWRSTGIRIEAFGTRGLAGAEVDDRPLLLAKVGDRIVAVDGACPHAGGYLPDGELVGRKVICPTHGAAYDLIDGHVVTDPDGIEPPAGGTTAITAYPTRWVDGVVEVDVPPP